MDNIICGLTRQVVSFHKEIFPFEVNLPIGPALGPGYKLTNCLEVTHMQTVQNQVRRQRILCLTRLYILCFHNVLLKVSFRRNVAIIYGKLISLP